MELGDEESETGDSNEQLFVPATGRKNWQRRRTTYQGGRWGINAWTAYINPLEMLRDGIAMYKLLVDVQIRKQTKIAPPESTEEMSNRTQDQLPETEDSHPMPQEQQGNSGYSPLSAHPHGLSEMTAVSDYRPRTLHYSQPMNSRPIAEYSTRYDPADINYEHHQQSYQ